VRWPPRRACAAGGRLSGRRAEEKREAGRSSGGGGRPGCVCAVLSRRGGGTPRADAGAARAMVSPSPAPGITRTGSAPVPRWTYRARAELSNHPTEQDTSGDLAPSTQPGNQLGVEEVA
jgi:hypothetical protein